MQMFYRPFSSVTGCRVLLAVLFSDVVTFTQIAASCTPVQVVQLLNQLYTYFDHLTERNRVYKVGEKRDDRYAYIVKG